MKIQFSIPHTTIITLFLLVIPLQSAGGNVCNLLVLLQDDYYILEMNLPAIALGVFSRFPGFPGKLTAIFAQVFHSGFSLWRNPG